MLKIIFSIVLFCFSINSFALGMEVFPIHLFAKKGQKSTQFEITNQTETDHVLDIRVKKWTMENGKTNLTDTEDIVLSKPVVTIPAGKKIIIRAMVVVRDKSQDEQAYRVLINDITPSNIENGVAMTINFNVPFFVTNTAEGKAVLIEKDGKIINAGNRHCLISGAKKSIEKQKTDFFQYLFPGDFLTINDSDFLKKFNVNELIWTDGQF